MRTPSFRNDDFRAVGEYECHGIVAVADRFEERVTVFSITSRRFYIVAGRIFNTRSVHSPVTVGIDGYFGFRAVFAGYRDFVSVRAGQPVAFAADRPVIDSFEQVDTDLRGIRAVFNFDGFAIVEGNRVPRRRFFDRGEVFC